MPKPPPGLRPAVPVAPMVAPIVLALLLTLGCNRQHPGTPNPDPGLDSLARPLYGTWQFVSSQIYADTSDPATAAYLDISRKYHALENNNLGYYLFEFHGLGLGQTLLATQYNDTLTEFFVFMFDSTGRGLRLHFPEMGTELFVPQQNYRADTLVLIQPLKYDPNDANIDAVIPRRYVQTGYIRSVLRRVSTPAP